MSGATRGFYDRVEGLLTRMYYSLNEEDFNCWAVISRYYSFRDHRKVLFGLNFFMAVVNVVLTAYTVYLAFLFYDDYYRNVWIGFAGLSCLFVTLATVSIIGMRGAHLVSLDHLLTYFWGVVVFCGPLILGVIACVDFYEYIDVWFKHQWELDNFANMRELFCAVYTEEDENAVGKCAAPLTGGADWCIANYNATDCGDYRDSSIFEAVEWCRQLSLVQAIIFGTEAGLCLIALALCHRIITDQVLTQSMNEVINYLLLLPIGTCAGLAYYLWWLNDYEADELEYFWLANSFMYVAIAQIVALPLGIVAGKLKNKWMLQLYIVLMLGILAAMILNGTICIIFAGILAEVFVPTTKEFGEIACDKNLTGCCCCSELIEDSLNRCPEWEADEIMSLLVLDMKISGVAAFGCALYPAGAFIIAVLVRAALANYKSDYVGVGKILSEEEKLEEEEGQEQKRQYNGQGLQERGGGQGEKGDSSSSPRGGASFMPSTSTREAAIVDPSGSGSLSSAAIKYFPAAFTSKSSSSGGSSSSNNNSSDLAPRGGGGSEVGSSLLSIFGSVGSVAAATNAAAGTATGKGDKSKVRGVHSLLGTEERGGEEDEDEDEDEDHALRRTPSADSLYSAKDRESSPDLSSMTKLVHRVGAHSHSPDDANSGAVELSTQHRGYSSTVEVAQGVAPRALGLGHHRGGDSSSGWYDTVGGYPSDHHSDHSEDENDEEEN